MGVVVRYSNLVSYQRSPMIRPLLVAEQLTSSKGFAAKMLDKKCSPIKFYKTVKFDV